MLNVILNIAPIVLLSVPDCKMLMWAAIGPISQSCLSTKVAKHDKIMLTRIRLPAKLQIQMHNLLLVSCSFLLSRHFFSKIFFILLYFKNIFPTICIVKQLVFKRFSQTMPDPRQSAHLYEIGPVQKSPLEQPHHHFSQ